MYFFFLLWWCALHVCSLSSLSATVSSSRCSSASRSRSVSPTASRCPSATSSPTRSRSTTHSASNLQPTYSRSARPTTGIASLTGSPSILFPSFSKSSTFTLCLSTTGSSTAFFSVSLSPSVSTTPTLTPTSTQYPSVSTTPTLTPTCTQTFSTSQSPTISVSPTASLSLPSLSSSPTLTISPVRTSTVTGTPILPSHSSSEAGSLSATRVQSPSVNLTLSGSASISPSPSPTLSTSKSPSPSSAATLSPSHTTSQTPSPSSTFSIFSPSPLVSFSPSISPSTSSSPSFTDSPSRTITSSLSISAVFTVSTSPSAHPTPSATQSGAPCNCDRNPSGCQASSFSFQWPESIRGSEVFPAPAASNVTRGVASWPLLLSTLSVSLPTPPSQFETVTVNCSVSGAKAAPVSLIYKPSMGGNATQRKGAKACPGAACASFVSDTNLTASFSLLPLGPVFTYTSTFVQCDIASFRPPTLPCEQGYSRYARLSTVYLEAVALPSNFSLLGSIILAVNSSQTSEIRYQDLGNPGSRFLSASYTPPIGCSLEEPCGDLNASLLLNLTTSTPPSSSNFSFTSGVSQHLILLANPAYPFPPILAVSIGNVNGTLGAILCRGVRDAPCTGLVDEQCCRVNWNTPRVASLTTPAYYKGAGSICAGNFWCNPAMILSDGGGPPSYALPIGDSQYSTLSLINSTLNSVGSVFNTSTTLPSPLSFSTSYPPAVNASSMLNPALDAFSSLPSPLAFASTYGVTLDVVPFPLVFANTFPGTCRGLCLTSQCPAPASPVGLCNTVPPSDWFNRTLPLNCFWGEGGACTECKLSASIAGGNCTDGSCMFCPSGNLIVVKKGFWAPSVFSRPDRVQPCDPPAEVRCPGTPIPSSPSYSLQSLVSPQCGKGYAGSFCTLCERGYYVNNSDDSAGQSRTCESCPAFSDYLKFLGAFAVSLSVVVAFFLGIYFLAVTILHSFTVLQLSTWKYTAYYTSKSFVRLVLWALVATQTASILFSRASTIAAPFLKRLYVILTALQYKGFENPPLECISVPFPLLWGSIVALGASYFFLFVILPLAFCLPTAASTAGGAGSTFNLGARSSAAAGGMKGIAVRVGVAVRRGILLLGTPFVLLLTLCFGAMTNAFADAVTCSPPMAITLDKYSSLGGDGSALPPGYPDLDYIRVNDPATFYAQNFTVTVTLLVANPSLVCLEGSHIPAYYAAMGGLAGFTFLYPILLLALLHSRGVTLCALFRAPPKAPMASSTPSTPSSPLQHSLDSGPSGPPSTPTSPMGGGVGAGGGFAPIDKKGYFDFLLYLLIDPTVKHSMRVFQPLQYLMLASVCVLLRLGQTFPSDALAANVALVLFTAAAAVIIKYFFRPYKDKLQWQNSSLASFYLLTAVTALCMAVSSQSNTSINSNTALAWIFGLLPVIAAIGTVMFVLYKWGRALLKNSRADLLRTQSRGERNLQAGEGSGEFGGGVGRGDELTYMDNPMGRRGRRLNLEDESSPGFEREEKGRVKEEEEDEPEIPPGAEIIGPDYFSTVRSSRVSGEDAWSPLRSFPRKVDTGGGGEGREEGRFGKEGDAWSPLAGVEQVGFAPSRREDGDDSGDGDFEGCVRPFGEVIPRGVLPEEDERLGVDATNRGGGATPSYHTSKLVELMNKHHRRSSRSQRH